MKSLKLGDKISVTEKYRRIYCDKGDRTTCTWKLEPTYPSIGIVCGIRTLSNGDMSEDGYIAEENIRVYVVALNMKSIVYIPYKEVESET